MSQPTLSTLCRPWCTAHHDGGVHPEDGYCQATAPTPAGDLLLTADDDGSVVLLLHRLQSVDLTLDQAAQVRDALDGLLARTAVAA